MDYVTERLAVEYGPGGLCGLCYYKGLSVDYVTIRDCVDYVTIRDCVDYVTIRDCLWIMLLRDWLWSMALGTDCG